MIDTGVKSYLKKAGSPPKVYYGGLPRLAFRWGQFCKKVADGNGFVYESFKNFLELRSQIHRVIPHATEATISRFAGDILDADKLLLSATNYFDKDAELWWMGCLPIQTEPKVAGLLAGGNICQKPIPTRYLPANSNTEPQDHSSDDPMYRKAEFMVANGELTTHCVGELKRSGLDADIDQDGKIDSNDETAILVDMVKDILANVDGNVTRKSVAGRECYLYERRTKILMLVFDPVEGGTAFIPTLGRRSFDSWCR